MKNFSLLVKPASYNCNLRCKYCFYLEKSDIFHHVLPMSEEILERMISSFLSIDMPRYSFGWQGGEPTLMGLDFFEKVISLQGKYAQGGARISNGLQTNGTLLNDKWCEHLAKYNFLVGISVDGPAEIHDKYRLTASGSGSHALVMKGLSALKRNNVEFNILTLVSEANVGSPILIYNYIKELGVNFHQYIECVDFASNGELSPYSVTAGRWGDFLCAIFDEWYAKDRYSVSVRLFDSILEKMLDSVANVCSMSNDCCQYFVVEHNGDIYPCDFFVLPELRLGNIMSGDWGDFADSPIYREFGERKSKYNEKCARCPYLEFCAACCPKNRFGKRGDPQTLSVLCEGWEIFYQHSLPRLKIIADEIMLDRAQALENERRMLSLKKTNLSQVVKKISRNEACPCGSGKKYKKCCGK
jgi:uncharacterized protein